MLQKNWMKQKIGALCFLAAVLFMDAGCVSLKPSGEKDGPPDFPRSVKNIPNAIPKVEAKSKYGNPSFYSVNGRRFDVLDDSQGFTEIGMASWYGKKFHGKRTSSGEPYNMYAMTAAHRSLPIPTYVKVTNLRNKKSVIVKVNDRGPFKDDRIIDLSYAAAHKIGVYQNGTAKVHISAIDPASWDQAKNEPLQTKNKHIAKGKGKKTGKEVAIASASNSQFYLQLGAFKKRSLAEDFVSKANELQTLNKSLHPYSLQIHEQGSTTAKYKVRLGPFPNYKAAQDLASSFKKQSSSLHLAKAHVVVD